jgi:hypothetical protein
MSDNKRYNFNIFLLYQIISNGALNIICIHISTDHAELQFGVCGA